MNDHLALVPPPSTLTLIRHLEKSGAMTLTGLDLPSTLTIENYESLGRWLGTVNRASRWWIGDYLNFGDGTYGERYAQAEQWTGLNEHTLQNYSSVCARVPRKHRGKDHRRAGVPFSVHAEIASLELDEQREWLDLAQMHDWKVQDVRRAMRERGRTPPQQPLWSPTVNEKRALEIAKRIIHEASSLPDGRYAVDGELIEQLRAAYGEGN